MNLNNLLKVMPVSVRLRNDQTADSGGGLLIKYCPPIRLDKEDKSLSETTPDSPLSEGKEETIDNTKTIRLFQDDSTFIDDLLRLAKVWRWIDAPDSMALMEKRREIARWLGGKRNIEDVVVLMELLAFNVDISNSWLIKYMNNGN